jgi:hypothetical protein
MPDPTPARSFLGGAAVVLLAGVAAYVGAGLARDGDAAPPPAAPAASGPSAAALESLERRIAYLEKRLDIVEVRVGNAGASDEPVAAPPAAPVAPTRPDETAKPSAPAVKPDAPAPDESPEGQMARIQARSASNRLLHTMSLFSDATADGDAARSRQAVSDAMAFVQRFALDGDAVEDDLRQVFADQWAAGARDVGPIVRDGLEKADIATVRDRLRTIQAETDRRLREFLNEEQRKEYEESAAAGRKAAEALLDEYERKRLSLGK